MSSLVGRRGGEFPGLILEEASRVRKPGHIYGVFSPNDCTVMLTAAGVRPLIHFKIRSFRVCTKLCPDPAESSCPSLSDGPPAVIR